MAGAVLMIVAMVVVVPVGTMLVGLLWSAIFGWSSVDDAERRHEGQPS